MRFDLGHFDKRRLARILAVLAVALAAGHLVQTLAARHQLAAAEDAMPRPVQVVQLAASADLVAEPPARPAPLPPTALSVTPSLPVIAYPAAPPTLPDVQPQVAVDPCPVTLDLMADPGAMIGLILLAPCHPDERVVLRHAGLAITVMTTATGSAFQTLPALQTEALVEARFADGSTVTGALSVPDLAGLRRFGVQWQGDDAFQVLGYESARMVSASNPGLAPLGDLPIDGGFLTRLGDTGVEMPLLAEIYTFPVRQASEVVVEAAVTPATCGREILGETLALVGGEVTVTELTLAMPGCDAVGDFLVLNNLAPDLTLAAAN